MQNKLARKRNPGNIRKEFSMKKLMAVLLLALLGTAVVAQGSSEAKSDKVKI
jgi:uncharacterized protein (UPF0333 family)